MEATLALFRTNILVSNPTATLTLSQVQNAFNSRVRDAYNRTYSLIVPRFKTTPGATANLTVLNEGAVTETVKSNYANWNWGRCPLFIPSVASGVDFKFCPSHNIPYYENEILLLINESALSGVAFVQGTDADGHYLCYSRFIFAYNNLGVVSQLSNTISANNYGFLGYAYAPNSNILSIGFLSYNEDLSSFTISTIRYYFSSGGGRMSWVRSVATGVSVAYLRLFGASSIDELCPSESSMGAIVKQDLVSYQLMYDPNNKGTSQYDRSKYTDMISAGVVKAPSVTVDTTKLDPYYLNTPWYYEVANGSGGGNSFGPHTDYLYQNGAWHDNLPTYIKDFICAGIGGTRAPGGGDTGDFLKNSGITLTPLSGISSIPNPATTNLRTSRYYNAAITSPTMKDFYVPFVTQGGISSENADPKWIYEDSNRPYSKENSTMIESINVMHSNTQTASIPSPAASMYWQGILPWNGLCKIVDSTSGKLVWIAMDVLFHYGTLGVGYGAANNPNSISFGIYDPNEYQAAFYNSNATEDPTDTPDPNDYNPNGPTAPEMNPGSFDDSSDTIPLPDKPTISVVDAGLITLFNPNLSQLQALSKYMWSDMTTTSGWFDAARKIFADPMQYFIALNILPFDVPPGSTVTVKLAGISTGVSITKAASQFIDIDCGSYALNEYWGSALDYAPSTKIWCFLPFVGSVPLDPDMVMKSTIRIVYRTDILTGAFVAFILANENVLYHFNGNMATNVPLTGADYSRLVSAIIGAASTIALTAGAGGAAGMAAMGVGAARTGLQAASAGMNQAISTVQAHAPSFGASMMRGGSTGIAGDMFQMLQANADELTTAGRNMGKATAARNAAGGVLAASGVHAVHNTVNAVMAAKPSIAISGQMSGCSGLMDIQYPYLIIQRPNQALPENYKHYVGYPSHMLADVQSCRGYTVFEQIELSGIPCTDDELAEINDILKGGFYG